MKRIISLSLALFCLLSILSSCVPFPGAGSGKNGLIPYGIRFGMSYDEVKSLDVSAGELNLQTGGYNSTSANVDSVALAKFYGLNGDSDLIWYPKTGYLFNSDKQLRAYSVLTNLYSETTVEQIYMDFVNYLDKALPVTPVTEEDGNSLSTVFETDELKALVAVTEDNNGYLLMLYIENKLYYSN